MLNAYDTWLTKPNQDLMSVRLCGVGEVSDGSDVPLAWFHSVTGDFKACKLNFVLGEAELLWVEGDPMSAACIQPVCSLEETLFNRV